MARASRCAAAVLAAALVASGCVSHTAPEGFLATPGTAGARSWGGWIDITVRDGTSERTVTGELLAANADSLWVLGAAGGEVVPMGSVLDGRLFGYHARHGQVAGGTAMGVVATISNGALLLITAPMWLIGGTAAAASQSRVGTEELPTRDWVELRKFARFPQGMPAGVELDEIRPSPLLVPPSGDSIR